MIVPRSWTELLPLRELFETEQPLVVDLGCGKGRFLAMRAGRDPQRNYLGIERLLVRVRKVDKKIARGELTNARVIRVEAAYAVMHLLPHDSVDEIFVLFPDPWPKKRHHKRRLFNPDFIDALAVAMRDDAHIHVATDHLSYFGEIKELLTDDDRFESCEPFQPAADERTEFETIFVGQNAPIGRCSFRKLSR